MKKVVPQKIIFLILIIGLILSALIFKQDIKEFIQPERLAFLIGQFGFWGPLFFILLYIGANVLLVPVAPLTLVAGIVFGVLKGTVYVWIGAICGGSLAFVVSRFIARNRAEKMIHGRFQKLAVFNEQLEKKGLATVAFLRLVPLFPFNGLSYALGLTRVAFKHFFIGTAVGIIPGTIVYTYFIRSIVAHSSTQTIIGVALLCVWVLVLYMIRSYYSKKNKVE